MKNIVFIIFYLPVFLFFSIFIYSADKYYPGSSWDLVSAESQGIKSKNVETLIDIAFADNSTLGVVVIKNGKIIGEKYEGNPPEYIVPSIYSDSGKSINLSSIAWETFC